MNEEKKNLEREREGDSGVVSAWGYNVIVLVG